MEWSSFVQFAGMLVAIIGGSAGVVPLINWLKQEFKLEGNIVEILSWVMSAVVAILIAVAGGVITPDLFADPLQLLTVVLGVIFGGNKLYTFDKSKRDKQVN